MTARATRTKDTRIRTTVTRVSRNCSYPDQLEHLRSQHNWVVNKEEVTLTQDVLRAGAYGEVKVVIF